MADGISLFALFYILAQLIERLVEVTSELGVFRSDKIEISESDRKIKDWQNIIDKSIEKNPSDPAILPIITKCQKTISNKEEEISMKKWKRIIGLWIIASFLGIFLCLIFKVGFLGIIKPNIPYDISYAGGPLDYGVSGVVIGSGTKPLHDIIAYIEKART